MQIIMGTKFRIYPNNGQQQQIDNILNCCRFIYNHMLERNIKIYKRRGEHLSYFDMQNLLPKMKKYLSWLNVDSQALKYSCRQLDCAYQKFFKHQSEYPKYHKKQNRQAYTNPNFKISHIVGNKIKIPTIGWVKAKGIKRLPEGSKICYITISREPNGQYYCSITYKYEKEVQPNFELSIIGLDYKSNGLYMDSNGKMVNMPHWFRDSQAKLTKAQRKLSKKFGSHKGEQKSSGWKKQYKKVIKIQQKISNQRQDYLHKLSKQLTNDYSIVAVEDINMQEISKNLNLGKATMDNGFGMFREMLKYKLHNQGKQLIKIDQYYPSSQICSCCGNQQKIPLSVREYKCKKCGLIIDRDYNAAINIKHEGIRIFEQIAY